MPSAASPLFPLNSAATPQWRELQTVYRRICILRSAGKLDEVGRLQTTELVLAIRALRNSAVIAQTELDNLFAAEEERVANAQVLAEILLPMLTGAAALFSQPVGKVAARLTPQPADEPVAAVAYAPPPPREEAGVAASAPGIADFIDEMLSQERSPRSSRRSA